MQEGYRAIKFPLRHFVARCGKMNLSQLLNFPMLMLLRHSRRRSEAHTSFSQVAQGFRIRTLAKPLSVIVILP